MIRFTQREEPVTGPEFKQLRKDLGEVFLAALADADTVEIVMNADGTLWQERLGEPLR